MGLQTTEYTTGSGTFVVPADLIGTTIDIELWGKGGNGGAPGNDLALAGGAGGGGGGYVKKTVTVSPSDSIAYSIGGSTTCSTFSLTANNGTNASSYTTAGTGGSASGGDTNTNGGNGSMGAPAVGTANGGGAGGNAGGGGTGGAGGAGSNGGDGLHGGGGGGGSYSEVISGVTYPGGTGGSGRVLFSYNAPQTYNETGGGGIVVGATAVVAKSSVVSTTGEGIAFGGNAVYGNTNTNQTQTYNSGSGNWTVPDNITSPYVFVRLWGGGGGGGGGRDGSSAGGFGGGGGAYVEKLIDTTAGSTIAYVVGAGGIGGEYDPETDATAGGNSTALGCVAGGGPAGPDGDATTPVDGGVASGGDTNTNGGAGGDHVGASGGGAGGSSPNGGAGGAAGAPGVAGVAPGGGGGGGDKHYDAGNGAAGRVQFLYLSPNTYTETPEGGLVAGGSALVAGDYTKETTGEGIVFAGDATITDGYYYEMSGGIEFGGDSEETDVITMDGGFVFSGEATVDPFVMSGGIRFGGVGSNDFNVTPTGGYRFGGAADVVADRFWDMSGGMKYGGQATTANNGEEVPEGGIAFGSSDDEFIYGMEFIETPSGEGFLFGGDSTDSMEIGTDGESLLFGGGADVVFDYNHEMQGGLIFGDGLFANGKKYRMMWAVPSDYVETDTSNFLLMLSFELPRVITADEVMITDIEGNEIKTEVVYLTDNRVVAAVRRDLSTSADTSGFVYYGE